MNNAAENEAQARAKTRHQIDAIDRVMESIHLLRQEIMPPLFDLCVQEESCPYMPRQCDTDCASWRGQSDGLGYCSRIHGDFGSRV